MGKRKCSVAGCDGVEGKNGNHFFSFPINDPERCQVWIRRSGNPYLEFLTSSTLRRKSICEKHFARTDFTSLKKSRLLTTATPIYAISEDVDVHKQLHPKKHDAGSPLSSPVDASKSQQGKVPGVFKVASGIGTELGKTRTYAALASKKITVEDKTESQSLLADVCRTCLAPKALTPLFPQPAQYSTTPTALHLSTGLQVTMDDGLPQYICLKCHEIIESFMLFRFQSQFANEHLQEFIKRKTLLKKSDPLFNDINLPTPAEIEFQARTKFKEYQMSSQTDQNSLDLPKVDPAEIKDPSEEDQKPLPELSKIELTKVDVAGIDEPFKEEDQSPLLPKVELPEVDAAIEEQRKLNPVENMCIKVERFETCLSNVKIEKFDSDDDMQDIPIVPNVEVNIDVKPLIKQEQIEVEETYIVHPVSASQNDVGWSSQTSREDIQGWLKLKDNGSKPKCSYSRKRKANFSESGC